MAEEAAVVLDTRPGECERAANSATISRVDLTFLLPALMTESICCSSMSVGGLFTLLLVFLLVEDEMRENCDDDRELSCESDCILYTPIISGLDGVAVAVVGRFSL